MTAPHRHPADRPIAALLVPDILTMLDEAPGDIAAETEELHPADLADVVELFPENRIHDLLRALPGPRAADVLEYLDEEMRATLLESLPARDAAQLVGDMTPDDRADALDEMDAEHAQDILSEIPTEARRETESLRAYEADTAGGLMTTEFVSVPAETTVEAALENVRALARSGRREAMYAIYATDAQGRLVGVMSLRELLAAAPGVKIGDVAWSEVRSVRPSADREEVARVIANYDLVAIPVVSESGHLMGVITVDDVIDAIQEEQTEDVQKFGGMEALDEPYMQISFLGMIRKRAGWLSVLLISEMLTTTAMQHFDKELERWTALALFVPLVMSSGGNSGSQATSLVTRAMALREVELKDWWRIAFRELPAGLALGAILGVIGMIRISLWQVLWNHHIMIGTIPLGYNYLPDWRLIALTVGCSLVGIVTFGSLAGSMLPFVLRRLGFDPASASAPFVATLVDVTGLSIYFIVALSILSWAS